MALIEGKLVLEDGCLRVQNKFLFWQRYSDLVIWRFGYTWKAEDSEIWILNEKSEKVAKVGDSVKMAGGALSSDAVESATGKEPPLGIEGPFWLMGDIKSQEMTYQSSTPSSSSPSVSISPSYHPAL